jgi:hypothetical protein
LSWWNYKEVAEKLQTDYHVFLPILDGHAGCDRQYTTIENNALVIYTPKVRHIWRCISVTVVPFYISEPQGSFLCGLRCQPNGILIGKSVEKSKNA